MGNCNNHENLKQILFFLFLNKIIIFTLKQMKFLYHIVNKNNDQEISYEK